MRGSVRGKSDVWYTTMYNAQSLTEHFVHQQSVIPLHHGRYPICPPSALRPILLVQPASPIPKKHILQRGPRALYGPPIPPNELLLVHPPALLRGSSEHDHLVRVELLGHAPHHLPTGMSIAPKLEHLVSRAERLERLDAAHHILLSDGPSPSPAATAAAFEVAKATEDAHELREVDKPAVALAGAHADVDDLHAKLALPVPKAKRLFPPPTAPRPRERVDADRRAHLLEVASEAGIVADVGAVVRRKVGERDAELLELRREVFYLGGGELVRESIEGSEGFLLSMESSQACAASEMHRVVWYVK